MGCTDDADDSRWYLPRCAAEGCNWSVNHEGDFCWCHHDLAAVSGTDRHRCGDPQCPDWERGEHFHDPWPKTVWGTDGAEQ